MIAPAAIGTEMRPAANLQPVAAPGAGGHGCRSTIDSRLRHERRRYHVWQGDRTTSGWGRTGISVFRAVSCLFHSGEIRWRWYRTR